MGVEWREYILEELADKRPHAMSTGPFGSAIGSKFFREEGVPVIRGSNLSADTGSKMSDEGLVYVDEEKAEEFQRSTVRAGDLVFTCWGTINQVGLITNKLQFREYIISNKQMKFTPDGKVVDPLFMYYLFSGPVKQAEILQNGIGAAVPGFNLGQLKEHRVKIPMLSEQKVIANMLGTLDDKIELNRQMNATLEAMAQALFKSWFVDFDPVIDNALAAGSPIPEPLQARADARAALGDQRKPLPKAIQKHFPSCFVFKEELGWVPEGWEVSTVGSVIEITGGGTPSTKDATYWEGGIHAFCTPKDMSRLGSLVLLDTERHLTDAGVSRVSSGQLPSNVVLMSSRAPIGYLAISDVHVSVNQGIIAMLPNEKFGSMYLSNWTHFNMGAIKDRANGSTFLEISKANFRPLPFLIPNEKTVSAFNIQSESIYKKLLLSIKQVRSVSALRDTLLPKLLSGQLRIPEAEKQVADVV